MYEKPLNDFKQGSAMFGFTFLKDDSDCNIDWRKAIVGRETSYEAEVIVER